ncbi:branched-chain amino acid ABC transporter permease [Natrinema sp. 1APR25-10V2]|uniref:branched-chain amino acid ABC transporter permease n=1 Tax=Natrinema sp. 1APR25-10V2 TaxID=2951081 RepID=UPI002874C2F1|nr:branched-chain amino acid ABC transporter permease [Natrinema sp. 1APR25-10V2]MDS0476956.1 branched-chain amino acid ABC transporter permease [Natrinema sp. 1APR25-10V2]
MQVLTGGLVIGALWALVALGLNLIFGVMKVINLAHGEFIVFGAFGTLYLNEALGIHPAIGIFLLLPVFFLAGVLIQYLVINRILESDNPELISLLATFGLFLFLNNVARAVFGVDPRSLQAAPLDQTVTILGVNITFARIYALMVATVAMISLYYLMTRTEFGRAMRGTVQNPRLAQAAGINRDRVYYAAFGLSAILASIAGAMIGMVYTVSVDTGFSYLIFGFLVIVFGGMGSFTGALAGALILGMVGSISGYLFDPGVRNLVLLSILVITLFVKPTGLFGGARV